MKINLIHNFSNECLYITNAIMIELTFLKTLIVIRQENHKSVIFATTGIFQITVLSFNRMSAMDTMIY